MKKLLVVAIITTSIFTLGGCTVKKDNNTEKNNNNAQEEVVRDSSDIQSYVGRVSGIVGNEVSLRIAKEQEQGEVDDEVYEENSSSESTVNGNDNMEAGNSLFVVEMDEDDSESFSEGIASSSFEFTDEVRDIIIPAGAEVFSFITVDTVKISDIKEGNVISIDTDSKGTIIKVTILE